MNHLAPHRFHIPVMGLAYTIDSPIKVARFGIASVISIVEDRLIELMRKQYYPFVNEPYVPITVHEENYREKRITDYLNLVHRLVQQQVETLRQEAFCPGSDIEKYFLLLPDDSLLKQRYREMENTTDPVAKEALQAWLRTQLVAGSIDVNIMTKVDGNQYNKQGEVIADGSDALTALRGYANSVLTNSAVIFSAGMNPRLYNYLEHISAFAADANGRFQKRVIVKVSDYRSALIQSKYLAKKGVWVSEFRVESGLNCGGHAFATDGYLLGPILEEFTQKMEELTATSFDLYKAALAKKGAAVPTRPPAIQLSVQGGIGTADEDRLLHRHYGVSSTGWGTPFLLVPEATTVDTETLALLCKATEKDVVLSNSSPLGIRFHYLKGTSAERERDNRIRNGKPGSPCTEKHLAFNTEFTEQPICTASHKYQKLKMAQLQALALPEADYQRQLTGVLEKECLCVGLSNAASHTYKQPFLKAQPAVTICPGPNIVHFTEVVSLQRMTDHIYGRTNIVKEASRPHMFIAELRLYVNYLREEINAGLPSDEKKRKYHEAFCQNLLDGIRYYRQLEAIPPAARFLFDQQLQEAEDEVVSLCARVQPAMVATN